MKTKFDKVSTHGKIVAMGFLRRITRAVTRPISSLADAIPGGNIIIPAAISMINPAAGAAYTASSAYGKGASLGKSLAAGAGQFVGSNLGGSIASGTGGTIGGALSKTLGNDLGEFVGTNLGSGIVGQNLGQVIGSGIGGNIGQSLAGADNIKTSQDNGASGPTAFHPSQESAQNAPTSITGLGSLTSEQQASNLATQGVYGQGGGPEEQSYFLNLLNRRLVDTGGNVQQADVSPIERSYLQRLGINATGDNSNLLEAISRWRQAA